MKRSAQILRNLPRACNSTGAVEGCTQLSLRRESSLATSTSDYDVQTVTAQLRDRSGRLASKSLRKEGRTPAILFSLPGNTSSLLTVPSPEIGKLVRLHGRSGMSSRLFNLRVVDDNGVHEYPVLPRMIHQNAKTDEVENITFMHCPPDRDVQVSVPVKVMGEDISPGVKKGGFVNLIRKRIRCWCSGSTIPASIEVDVSHLDMGGRVGLEALVLPSGVDLAEEVMDHPVCKIAGKASRT